MFSHITLLTLEGFKPAFFSIMEKYCEGVRYNFAFDRPMFEDILKTQGVGKSSLLLSFGTGVIVKRNELDQFGLCLNIHPSTPRYPGLHPHAFAWADGVKHYGTTAHIMSDKIDDGPIVMVETFDVSPSWSEDELLDEAVYASFELCDALFQSLFKFHKVPETLPISWHEHRYTKQDYDALKKTQGMRTVAV